MLQQAGKFIVLSGVVLVVFGGLLYGLGRLGVGRLPGDVSFASGRWRVHILVGTGILLSILLTIALQLLSRLRR
ncbi:MAG: DUF2905 family protein [Phycisphaerae bacterium]